MVLRLAGVILLFGTVGSPAHAADTGLFGGKYGLKTEVSAAWSYSYSEDDHLKLRGYPTTEISWIGACNTDSSDETCSLQFQLTRRGEVIFDDEDGGTGLGDAADDGDPYSEYADPGYFKFARDWSSCDRSGKYRWTLTASYSDVPAVAPDVKRGAFQIPKCRARKPRAVSAAAAAAAVNSATSERYPEEFVSQVRCGSGRRSHFRCQIARNNNYRECSQGVSVRFFATNQFGRRDNHSIETFGASNCQSF